MKTTGAVWSEYLNSWPEGQWFDDSDETINGQSGDEFDLDIPKDAVVEFTSGVVYSGPADQEGTGLVKHFKAWLKTRGTTTFVVTVPKEKESELRGFVKSIKGTVH